MIMAMSLRLVYLIFDRFLSWLMLLARATSSKGIELLGVKAAHAGYSVLFDTANNWITRLAAAHQAGQLEAELKKIRRYKLIIIDEVGYIPFDQDAANLFFQLIASRYEQASVMVTSNLPFGRWGETFSDDIVAAAMIDRLVHHAEVLTLTGDSYRTRQRRELLAKQNRTQRD
jgi:DNA replication protein DnaC